MLLRVYYGWDGRVIQTRGRADVVLQVTVTLGNTHVYRVRNVLYVSQSMHNINTLRVTDLRRWMDHQIHHGLLSGV